MMEPIDSELLVDPIYPQPIVCATPESCKEFIDSGLALQVATDNVIAHGVVIKRYNALRQYTIKLVEDYNRIATKHNQTIKSTK